MSLLAQSVAAPVPLHVPFLALIVATVAIIAIIHPERLRLNPWLLAIYGGCAVSYWIAVIRTSFTYKITTADNIYILTGFAVLFVYGSIDRARLLAHYQRLVFYLTAWLMFFIAVYGNLKFFMLLRGVKMTFLVTQGGKYPQGSSLVPDYNMTSFSLTCGAISAFHLGYIAKNNFSKALFYLMGIVISVSGFLTGSRRFYLVIGGLIVYVLVRMFIRLYGLFAGRIKKKSLLGVFAEIGVSTAILGAIIVGANYAYIAIFAEKNDTTLPTPVKRLFERASLLVGGDRGSPSIEEPRAIQARLSNKLLGTYSNAEWLFGRDLRYHTYLAENYLNEGDKPHNPFISAILYGGIVGASFAVVLLLGSIYGYWKVRREQGMLGLMFIVGTGFIIVSADNMFSSLAWLMQIILGYCFWTKRSPNIDESRQTELPVPKLTNG